MLNLQDATQLVKRSMPNGKIQKVVEYKNLFLFMIFTDDPLEEEMDPFYSVNRDTGEFRDFSIFEDGDPEVIFPLFEAVR